MRNILIIGAGISGLGAAQVLLERNCSVIISDLHENHQHAEEVKKLKQRGAVFRIGPQTESIPDGIDTVLVSPVVPPENPIVKAAREKQIPVISEIELAYRLAKAPILAVTGTNGKTTVTKLLGDMIAHAKIPYAVAGNVGVSLSVSSEHVPADGLIAAEVSSFQLECIDTFRPRSAVILNITPDHFERHHTMEAYVQAKARIFENMTKEDCLLLNACDPYTAQLRTQAENTHVCLFNTESEVEEGAFLDGDWLMLRRKDLDIRLCTKQELILKGRHNWENCLAAAFLAHEGGVPVEAICQSLRHFAPLAHRIEFVRTYHGVSYYNDSKATNTDAAQKALEAFPHPVILIAGGHDKKTPLKDFMGTVKRHVKYLILIGESSDRFLKAAEETGVTSIEKASDMKDAVRRATGKAKDQDIVLLSPACSSYDMYSCYQERGNDFKAIVNQIR